MLPRSPKAECGIGSLDLHRECAYELRCTSGSFETFLPNDSSSLRLLGPIQLNPRNRLSQVAFAESDDG
jgi:hypothetical protein